MDFERRARHSQEVNLTALIDIVFHIMFFVMFTTTFVVSESLELSLPSDHAAQSSPSPELMRIMISPGGGLSLNGQPVTENDINTQLADKIGSKPDTAIVVISTPRVSVQELVHVIDMVYLLGGRNLQVDEVKS